MPVALGRNVSILVEIAARNHVLKLQGHHSAREFARKLEEQIERDRQRRRRSEGGGHEAVGEGGGRRGKAG
jgi:HPr kinase/phosphorylase